MGIATCIFLSMRSDGDKIVARLKHFGIEAIVKDDPIDFTNDCIDNEYDCILIENCRNAEVLGMDVAYTLRSAGVRDIVLLLCEDFEHAQYEPEDMARNGVRGCLYRPLNSDSTSAQLRTFKVL